MPVERLNGIELYYESHGDGPALVFLHGAGGNHISWWQQVPNFNGRFRCITVDHRGFGFSTDPGGEGAARYVDDLEELLQRLGVERAALVAQSMGGRTALGFAVRHPESVSALVMCDTWGFFDWPELQQQAAKLREENPRDVIAVGGMAPGFPERHPRMAFLYRQVQGLNPERSLARLTSPVTRAQVAALRVPTLFIVGTEDRLTSPEIIRRVHGLIRDSEFVEFEGCGHSVYWENAVEFNATVGAFLSEHP